MYALKRRHVITYRLFFFVFLLKNKWSFIAQQCPNNGEQRSRVAPNRKAEYRNVGQQCTGTTEYRIADSE